MNARYTSWRRLTAIGVALLLATPAVLSGTAAVLLGALAAPLPVALADGDPASDVLLAQNVFFPYQPVTSPAEMRALNGATAAAAKAGAPVKVALIASPIDLGVIPEVFGKPQTYADFLDQEISFNGRQPLLVVMADGYGTQGLDGAAADRVTALPPPAGKTSDALAAAAVVAVDKIAAAEGHPITAGAAAPASPSGSSDTGVIVGLLAAAAVATAGAIGVLTVRRRRSAA